jgi:ankyrin repeat protein
MIDHALRHGADVNAASGYAHRTPLMVAALHGRVEATRLLLAKAADAAADAAAVDDKGYTALRLATVQHHPNVAYLLRRKAPR